MFLLDFAVPESRRGEVAGLVAAILRGQAPERVVLPMLTRGGGDILCEWHTPPWRRGGRVTSVIAGGDRARAVGRVLRRSEARFRRVFETSLVGLAVSRADGTVVEANDALLTMIGYTRDDYEAGAIPWPDLTPEQYRPLDDQSRRDLVESGVFAPFDKEYLRKDGTRVPVRLGGATLDDEEGVRQVRPRPDRPPRGRGPRVGLASPGRVDPPGAARLHRRARPRPRRLVAGLAARADRHASGFIAEVLHDDRGLPLPRGPDDHRPGPRRRPRRLPGMRGAAGLRRNVDARQMSALFDAVVTTGRPVIVNNPEAVPGRGGQAPRPSLRAELPRPAVRPGGDAPGRGRDRQPAGGLRRGRRGVPRAAPTTCAAPGRGAPERTGRRRAEAELRRRPRRPRRPTGPRTSSWPC